MAGVSCSLFSHWPHVYLVNSSHEDLTLFWGVSVHVVPPAPLWVAYRADAYGHILINLMCNAKLHLHKPAVDQQENGVIAEVSPVPHDVIAYDDLVLRPDSAHMRTAIHLMLFLT